MFPFPATFDNSRIRKKTINNNNNKKHQIRHYIMVAGGGDKEASVEVFRTYILCNSEFTCDRFAGS